LNLGPGELTFGPVMHTYSDGPAVRDIVVTVSDDRNDSDSATQHVNVNNLPPSGNPGGPYQVADDGSVMLTASATDPAGASDPITFTWDLDDDGIYGETGVVAVRGDEVGPTPTFSAVGLPVDHVAVVHLRVDDGDGGVQDSTTMVQVVTANADAFLASQRLREGLLSLDETLSDWATSLGAGLLDLPVIASDLSTLFGLQSELSGITLPNPTDAATFPSLASNLTSLGFMIDWIPGGSIQPPSANELVQARLLFVLPPISGLSEFDDDTMPLLANLAALANLDGSLEWTADVSLELVVGVDPTGFYLLGESALKARVTGGGVVSDDFLLPIASFSLGLSGTAEADLTTNVTAASATQRFRLSELAQLSAALAATVDGDAEIDLAMTLSPIGLAFDGRWNLEVNQGIVTPTADVDFPTPAELFGAALPLLTTSLSGVFGTDLAAMIDAIRLPFAEGAGPARTAPAAVGGNNRSADGGGWFDSIVATAPLALKGVKPASRGAYYTEGDSAMRANLLRLNRNVSGAGVRIGVISSGAIGYRTAQSTDDLELAADDVDSPNDDLMPSVDIVPGMLGIDGIGTAMMEIIQDVAPDAKLFFAAAVDKASYLDAIRELVATRNVDILVSDVLDYTEPWFESGQVAELIQSYLDTRSSLVFLQAAGDNGHRHVSEEFAPETQNVVGQQRTLHDFDGSPAVETNTVVRLDAKASARLVLQWDDPFNARQAELRLLIRDAQGRPVRVVDERGGVVVEGASDGNISVIREIRDDPGGSNKAIDMLVLQNRGAYAEVNVAVELITPRELGSLPIRFKLFGPGSEFDVIDIANSLISTAAIPHAVVVGAVDIQVPDLAEDISSRGASLDVMSFDVVQVSPAAGLPGKFGGTSAAVAHVAGLAALLKQLQPTASRALIATALNQGAVDLGMPMWDDETGFGRVDALTAAQWLAPEPLPDARLTQSFAGPFDTGSYPPDPSLAVGPSRVVALVNSEIAIYDKVTGVELYRMPQASFWGNEVNPSGSHVFDAKVLFDPHSHRFIAVTLESDVAEVKTFSKVLLAISSDASPRDQSDWYKTSVGINREIGGQKCWFDYPGLGVDAQAVYVTGNLFNMAVGDKCRGNSELLIFNKIQLTASPATTVVRNRLIPSSFTIQPALNFDSSAIQYFAEEYAGKLRVYTLADPLGAGTLQVKSVDVAAFHLPPDAPALGGLKNIDSGDTRLMNAVFRNGSLWTTHAVGDLNANEALREAHVRWYEIAPGSAAEWAANTAMPMLQQHGDIDPGPGVFTHHPQIAVNVAGDVAIVMAQSSATTYGGAVFTGRNTGDAAGTMHPIGILQNGQGPYERVDTDIDANRNRWGDYAGAAVDPNDDTTFWIMHEYASTENRWATQIGHVDPALFGSESPFAGGVGPLPGVGAPDDEDEDVVPPQVDRGLLAELLDALPDVEVELVGDSDQNGVNDVIDFLLGRSVSGDLLRVRIASEAADTVPAVAEWSFDLSDVEFLGGFGPTGTVMVSAAPSMDVELGWDAEGFFLDGTSALAADLSANAVATVEQDEFDATVTGGFSGRLALSFAPLDAATGGDGKIRLDEFTGDLGGGFVALAQGLSLSNLSASLTIGGLDFDLGDEGDPILHVKNGSIGFSGPLTPLPDGSFFATASLAADRVVLFPNAGPDGIGSATEVDGAIDTTGRMSFMATEVTVTFEDALEAKATGVTFTLDPANPGLPIFEAATAEAKLPQIKTPNGEPLTFQLQPVGEQKAISVRRDGLDIASVTHVPFNFQIEGIVNVVGWQTTLSNLSYSTNTGWSPTAAINIAATEAQLFPLFQPGGLATLKGFSGRLDASGNLSVDIREIYARYANFVDVSAIGTEQQPAVHFSIGPHATGPLLSVTEVTGVLPTLGLTLKLQGFGWDRPTAGQPAGRFFLSSGSIDNTGFSRKFGLADVLPVDLRRVAICFPDSSDFNRFHLGAEARIDIAKLEEQLGFTPIVSVVSAIPAGCPSNFLPVPNPAPNGFLTATLDVQSLLDAEIRLGNVSEIVIGLNGLPIGDLELNGFLRLRDFQNGVPNEIAGKLGLQQGLTNFAKETPAQMPPPPPSGIMLGDGEILLGGSIVSDAAGTRMRFDATGNFDVRFRLGDVIDFQRVGFAFHLDVNNPDENPLVPGNSITDVTISAGLDRLSFGSLTIKAGPLKLTGTGGLIDFNPVGDDPILSVDKVTARFIKDGHDTGTFAQNDCDSQQQGGDAGNPLVGWCAEIENLQIGQDGLPIFPGTIVTLTIPPAYRAPLKWLPLSISSIGVKFNEGFLEPDPANNNLPNLTKWSILASGTVGQTNEFKWPITGTFDEAELDVDALLHVDPANPSLDDLPIKSLKGGGIGIPKFSVGGVEIAGDLSLGSVTVNNQNVFYVQIAGTFKAGGIGAGLNIVLTDRGPLVATVSAPLAVPLGPTGLVLTGVTGGMLFGSTLPNIDVEALDQQGGLIGDDADPRWANPLKRVQTHAGGLAGFVTDAITTLPAGTSTTWFSPLTLILAGTFTHVTAPGIVTGDLTLGANLNFGDSGNASTGLTLIGFGEAFASGMPLGAVKTVLSYEDPLAPKFAFGFEAPLPGSVLNFLMPAEAEFTLGIDTKGLVIGTVIGVGTFFDRVARGVSGAVQSYFSSVLDQMAQDVYDANPQRPGEGGYLHSTRQGELGPHILDTQLHTGLSIDTFKQRFRDKFEFVSGQVPFLPLNFADLGATANLTATLNNLSDKLQAVLHAFFNSLDKVEATADQFADAAATFADKIVEKLQGGAQALLAFADIVEDAVTAAADAAAAHFDPVFTLKGHIQPTIFGIPFGRPEQSIDLIISKSGLFMTAEFSVTETMMGLLSGGLTNFLPLPELFNDHSTATIKLPFQNLFRDLLHGDLPAIDPLGSPWEIAFSGELTFIGITIGQIAGLVFAENSPILNSRLQWKDADSNDDGVFDDPASGFIQVAADKLPKLEHGGILLDARLTLPKLLTDPLEVFREVSAISIPDPVTKPLDFVDYLKAALGEVEDLDTLGQIQLFVPNFTDELLAALAAAPGNAWNTASDVINNPPADLLAALRNVVSGANTTLRNTLSAILTDAYFEGDMDLKLLSLPIADAHVEVESSRFIVHAGAGNITGLPIGVALDFAIDQGTQGQPRIGAEVILGSPGSACPAATLGAPTQTSLAVLTNLLEDLGVPAGLLVPDSGGIARLLSPGWNPNSSDALLRSGGVELCGTLDLWDVVDASFRGRISGEDFLIAADASVSFADPLGIASLSGDLHVEVGNTVGFDAAFNAQVSAFGQTASASGHATSDGCVTLSLDIANQELDLYIDLKKGFNQYILDSTNCTGGGPGIVTIRTNTGQTEIVEPLTGRTIVPVTVASSGMAPGQSVSVHYSFQGLGERQATHGSGSDYQVFRVSNTSTTLTAVDDATFLGSGSRDGSGSATSLKLQNFSGTNSDRSALLRFDVGPTVLSLPESALIESAVLRLRIASARPYDPDSPGDYLELGLFEVTDAWNETASSGGNSSYNRGATKDTGARFVVPITPSTLEIAVEFPISTLVRKWRDGSVTSNGVEVRIVDSQGSNLFLEFFSSEIDTSSVRPKLVVKTFAPSTASGDFSLTESHATEKMRVVVNSDNSNELDERFKLMVSLNGSPTGVLLSNATVPFTIQFAEATLPTDRLVAWQFDGLFSPYAGDTDPYEFVLDLTFVRSGGLPFFAPTITGSPVTHTDSVVRNHALQFKAGDQPLAVALPGSAARSSATVEFLAQVDSLPAIGSAPLFRWGTVGPFVTLSSTGSLRMQQDSASMTLGNIAPGIWRHVSLVVEPNLVTAYLDGTLVGTLITKGFDAVSPATLSLGGSFAGRLDEFRLWNKTFPSHRIEADLVNRSFVGHEAALALYYRFDESSGSLTVADRTVFGRNATLSGIASGVRPSFVDSTAMLGYVFEEIGEAQGLPRRGDEYPVGAFSNSTSANNWVATISEPVMLSANLLVNGAGEQPLSGGTIPGWTGNWRLTPSVSSPAPLAGQGYIAGPSQTMNYVGRQPVPATLPNLVQLVDVSSYANLIDHGEQEFLFNGYVRSKQENQTTADGTQIVILFLNAQMQLTPQMIAAGAILDTGMIRNTASWQQVNLRQVAPVGTRYINVTLKSDLGSATPTSSSKADGYFDGLSLQAIEDSKYYEFSVGQPDLSSHLPGTTSVVTVTGLQFQDRRSSNDPTHWELRSSLDGFARPIATGETHSGFTVNNVALPAEFSCLDLNPTPLTFRLYGIGDGNQSWRIDNLAVRGDIHSRSLCPAAVPDSYAVVRDTPTTLGVLANDTNGGGTLQIYAPSLTQPAHGTVVPVPTVVLPNVFFYTLNYTPNGGFVGTDTFTYRAVDGGHLSAPVTVTVTVVPPVTPPVAVGDSFTTNEDQQLTFTPVALLTNDDPGNGTGSLNVSLYGPSPWVTQGSLAVQSGGTLVYTPPANFHGTASFQYKAVRGTLQSGLATVTITVLPVNDAPHANPDTYTLDLSTSGSISGNIIQGRTTSGRDTDVDGDSLTVEIDPASVNFTPADFVSFSGDANGAFTLVPALDNQGNPKRSKFTFKYRAKDPSGLLSNAVTVTINVTRGAAKGSAQQGYVSDATVFIDTNSNLQWDYVDSNGNGAFDPDDEEPAEPLGQTGLDGHFEFPLPEDLDANSNGVVDLDEGVLVAAGGLTTSTLVPVTVPLLAPVESAMITSLTSLLTTLGREHDLTVEQAASRIIEAFELPAVDLLTFDALAATAAGDTNGPAVYAVAVALADLYVQLTHVLAGATGLTPAATSSATWSALADVLAATTETIDFAAIGILESVFTNAATRLGASFPPDAQAITGLVASAWHRAIREIPLRADLAFLQDIVRVESVAMSQVAVDLRQFGGGNLAADELLSRHTGDGLVAQIAQSPLGLIVPPATGGPRLANLTATPAIAGGESTLFGSVFNAPPSATVSLLVRWGDGRDEAVEFDTSEPTFRLAHAYSESASSDVGDGVYSISVLLLIDGVAVDLAGTPVTVEDRPVVADAGVDRLANEGEDVTLFADETSTIDLAQWSYAWEIADPLGEVLASGSHSTISFVPADNGTYTATLTVSDDTGASTSDTIDIVVLNVNPTAALAVAEPAVANRLVAASIVGAADPSPTDTAAGLRFSFDFDDDGQFEIVDSPDSQTIVPAAFLVPGLRTIRGRVTDKDGGASEFTTSFIVYDTGDFNFDGQVGLLDLAILQGRLGALAMGHPADLNGDGQIDRADVAAFVRNFGHVVPVAIREPSDLNRDGRVDLLDLAIVQQSIGKPAPFGHLADLNVDGIVDRADVAILARDFGRAVQPPIESSAPSPPAAITTRAAAAATPARARLHAVRRAALTSHAVDQAISSRDLQRGPLTIGARRRATAPDVVT
jgi:hypothetical protein